MPRVSVVIPAYNAEATIDETLATVQAQTHRSIEVILVDDGSRDDTVAIAERRRASDPRIRILQQANGGVAQARNAGMAAAQGDWIATLDADDLWHPRKLEAQLAAAACHRGTDFVYCWSRHIDPESRAFADLGSPHFTGRIFEQLLCRNFMTNASVVILRREMVDRIGGFDASLQAAGAQGAEDLDFYLRLAAVGVAAVAPAFLVGYRRHPTSMSTAADRMARSIDVVLSRYDQDAPPAARRISRSFYDIYVAGLHHASGDLRSTLRHLKRAVARAPASASITILAYAVWATGNRRGGSHLPPFAELDPETLLAGPAARAVARLRDWQIDRAARMMRRDDRANEVRVV